MPAGSDVRMLCPHNPPVPLFSIRQNACCRPCGNAACAVGSQPRFHPNVLAVVGACMAAGHCCHTNHTTTMLPTGPAASLCWQLKPALPYSPLPQPPVVPTSAPCLQPGRAPGHGDAAGGGTAHSVPRRPAGGAWRQHPQTCLAGAFDEPISRAVCASLCAAHEPAASGDHSLGVMVSGANVLAPGDNSAGNAGLWGQCAKEHAGSRAPTLHPLADALLPCPSPNPCCS